MEQGLIALAQQRINDRRVDPWSGPWVTLVKCERTNYPIKPSNPKILPDLVLAIETGCMTYGKGDDPDLNIELVPNGTLKVHESVASAGDILAARFTQRYQSAEIAQALRSRHVNHPQAARRNSVINSLPDWMREVIETIETRRPDMQSHEPLNLPVRPEIPSTVRDHSWAGSVYAVQRPLPMEIPKAHPVLFEDQQLPLPLDYENPKTIELPRTRREGTHQPWSVPVVLVKATKRSN